MKCVHVNCNLHVLKYKMLINGTPLDNCTCLISFFQGVGVTLLLRSLRTFLGVMRGVALKVLEGPRFSVNGVH